MKPNQDISKIILIKSIWKHLTSRRKKQLILLFGLILLSGIAEIYSIASLIPFLNAFSNAESNYSIAIIEPLYEIFSPLKSLNPILFSTIIFLFCISIAAFLRLINLYAANFISAAIGSEFSSKAYNLTLNQPYRRHIEINSSEIISSIVTQTDVTVSVIKTIILFITSIIISTGLIYSLFIINWFLSISISLILISLYLILGAYFKIRLNKVSESRAILINQQTKSLQEGLGSIKDIILDNSQEFYSKLFSKSDQPIRFLAAKSEFIAGSPKYIFEVISLFIIILIALIYKVFIDFNANIIPLLGTMALGIQRLLPSFQQAYNSWVIITTSTNSVLNLLKLLDQNPYLEKKKSKDFLFKNKITLKNISFSYKKNSRKIIKSFNLEIFKGDRIGIIGPSGGGKSTLADLLMGLLKPTQGIIEIDGIDLHRNNKYFKKDWYRNISHVPQDIFLIDSSIAENIAFGVPFEKIDKKKLMLVIHLSRLSNFIKNIDDAFSTNVGERGLKLSGGQRQRIGIARALYKGGNILILDEATSALDQDTEASIMQTIDNLNSSITVIVITHRLSTLKKCDRIIDLGKN
ncbi:MAG: ABC transporter ATP-binding protein/permease [Prochlorococcus marinus CUG1439]|uniref:ABC transporter ATP-binding protein n=1 Tax=Prochlorococcus sp. MIT 1314 TaxID=3096220 RepID=UPI001B1D1965|nr:ABC transporter ATP-binding protein [Prochlorococcus sp. MIT 1314]MCR8538815.1 ABC transporter ATP-binding protein/permease [Prochlorococcus marinus CUG1439]